MNIYLNLFVVLTICVHQGICINTWMPWNWGNKPRPIDGNWSPWSSWSPCQISSETATLPFRYKQRECTNPSPKNGGADCKGQDRRTSRCEDCNIALGMESGRIQDSFITALDSHKDFPASAGRLNGESAWCSDYPDTLQEPLYLEIDLEKLTMVSAIATQGFYPAAELLSLRMGRVSKYQIRYSTDGVSWDVYKNSANETILQGNKKRNGTKLNILTPEITARFIRVYPASYFTFVCMRLELYGCSFGCGGSLTQDPGSIMTESSPTEDQDCLWFVNMPNKTKLHFDFINLNIPCSSGHAELRSGDMPYSVAPVLAKYCGYDSPPPLVSSDSGKLWVRFKSNASDPQVGFYAVYFPGCGGQLYGTSGELMSPNYPKEYFHNSKCIWTITVPENKTVQLRFVEFKVEGDINRHRCPHDHLSIWNGSDLNAPLIGKFCDSNLPPPMICSSGNTLRLKFRSDDALAWTGFLLSYRAVDPSSPCSELSSSVIMPTTSRPLATSTMPLMTPTPFITTQNSVSSQRSLSPSSNYLVQLTTTSVPTSSIGVLTAIQASPSVNPIQMATNGTVGFMGTPYNGDMQAAAQGQRENDDDDDDNDALTTLIIISAFGFIVVCMIIASIVPGIKHHFEKRRREKEMNLMVAASVSIPETNSKETFEVVPIPIDDNPLPVSDSTACEAMPDEESLFPVQAAESVSLSETPIAELNDEQGDGVEDEEPIENEAHISEEEETLAGENQEELDDEEDGEEEEDATVPFINSADAVELGSLKMSYEDLGSSFVCEMQAMLSHLEEDAGDQSGRNLDTSTNPENSPQDGEHEAEETGLEAGDDMPTEDDTNSTPSDEETTASKRLSDYDGGKLEGSLNGNDADTVEIWEMQPTNSHNQRKTAGENRVSGSCTDSKDSGCASSSENLQSVENYHLYTGNNETSV